LRQTTIRFSEELWALLTDAADRQGTSAAEYVRTAVIVQLARGQDDAAPVQPPEDDA
jgi:hypothetical protein